MTHKNVVLTKPLIQLSPESISEPRLLRIGDLAEKTGKTKRALRLYEEMGLLVPSDRTSGGFRLYTLVVRRPLSVQQTSLTSRLSTTRWRVRA